MNNFFTSFNWAVPIAFSDAVNLCRFEEGDVLYDTFSAYGGCWREAHHKIGFALQVLYPARSSSAIKGAGGVFEKNWSSEVRVDLYKNLRKPVSITTTQGKLYSALWKGDLDVLEAKVNPSLPIKLKQIMPVLKELPNTLTNYSNGHLTFILPRDISNSVSKLKYQKINSVLSPHLHMKNPIILSPKDAGLSNCETIAPTIDIVLFPMTLNSKEELTELIKSAVYVQSQSAKRSMFRIASHGIIID
jgi:hypothetical protein